MLQYTVYYVNYVHFDQRQLLHHWSTMNCENKQKRSKWISGRWFAELLGWRVLAWRNRHCSWVTLRLRSKRWARLRYAIVFCSGLWRDNGAWLPVWSVSCCFEKWRLNKWAPTRWARRQIGQVFLLRVSPASCGAWWDHVRGNACAW